MSPRDEKTEPTDSGVSEDGSSVSPEGRNASTDSALASTRRRLLGVASGVVAGAGLSGTAAALDDGVDPRGARGGRGDRRQTIGRRADPAPGTTYWTFEGDGAFRSSPTVVDGTVYAGTSDEGRTMYAVDAETGEREWSFQVGREPDGWDKGTGMWGPPQVKGGRVFFGAMDFAVYALDAETGEQLWRHETDKHVYSCPTVVDGVAYVACRDGTLRALDVETGESVWQSQLDISGSSPAVVDGSVYAGAYSDEGVFASYDAETGDKEWERNVFETCSSPSVVDGTVYTGSLDEYIYALDAESGEITWQTELPGTQDAASVTVKDGLVLTSYFARPGLTALDRETGDIVWEAGTGAAGWMSPTTVGDTVFLTNQVGDTYGVDLESGEILWQEDLLPRGGSAEQSNTIVVDGVLFVGTADGRLHAIESGVAGSSDDSRVRQGILNTHHGWAGTAKQEFALPADTPTPTGTPTDTPTPSATPTPRTGYGEWFDGVSEYRGTVDYRGRDTVRVTVGAGRNGLQFDPPAVLVDPGTTVEWWWSGEGPPHNVVAAATAAQSFGSELVADRGHTFTHEFASTGIYRYFCGPHRSEGMVGAVAVGSVDDTLLAPADADGTETAAAEASPTEGASDETGGAGTGAETATTTGTPGFGVGVVLSALAGTGAAIRRLSGDGPDDESE